MVDAITVAERGRPVAFTLERFVFRLEEAA
jgi:hypothetical protein